MNLEEELNDSLDDIKRTLTTELSGTERAALLREKRITLNELAALAGTEKGSSVDEIQRQREARQARAGVGKKAN